MLLNQIKIQVSRVPIFLKKVFVELTPGDADESALLLFRFQDPMALLRRWQIKVTQIRCSSVDRSGIQEHLSARMTKLIYNFFLQRPPSGCLQYHTSPSGRFSTFNFSPEAGNIHLANQVLFKNRPFLHFPQNLFIPALLRLLPRRVRLLLRRVPPLRGRPPRLRPAERGRGQRQERQRLQRGLSGNRRCVRRLFVFCIDRFKSRVTTCT